MLPRLFLLGLVVVAVVTIVRRLLEQERARREERLSVGQRLEQLDELLRREVISRAEYDEARLRIITEEPDPPG